MKTVAVSLPSSPMESSDAVLGPRLPESNPRLLPYLFIHGFLLCLFWPLFLGRRLYWGDILLYFEPMQRFAHDVLQSGRLPLWNPYLLCGQPYLGNPQMGVFYPLNLL